MNSFALVVYIPEPLGSFLDRLRFDLEPDSLNPRAHVTILPPRPLADLSHAQAAADWLRPAVSRELSFPISIGGVEVFPGTNVVYLSIRDGFDHLREIHARLNHGEIAFDEHFLYHPHITLVQNLDAGQAAAVADAASLRWNAWKGIREFPAEAATFVQECSDRRWTDLESMALVPAAVPVSVRR
jgi:2'-5' RNA ligase